MKSEVSQAWSATDAAAPKPVITVVDAVALVVGMVIGAGIFGTPSIVASMAASESMVYLTWILGGVISFVGALVYAELTTTYPHAGGEYHYLGRAFGQRLAFLFAWARLSVIQTGSIAAFAFVFGDYLGQILSLGQFSSSIYATLIVGALTALNIIGVREGTLTQRLLTTAEVSGVVLIIVVGLFFVSAPSEAAAAGDAGFSNFGSMMLFVLFTYGGWNEAAYISGELRDVRRNMLRALFFSIGTVTALYVLINWAYLHALGLKGTAGASLVAADVMNRAFGPTGAVIISVLVAVAAVTSANATIFTGARTSYAFGRDFSLFGFLGRWNAKTSTPVNALLLQGGVALALVLFGTMTRTGLRTAIDYTTPVFWTFFLLTGVSLFVLRSREPNVERPFRVPLYPVTPVLFCLSCAYMLYSSLDYNRAGALAGVGVLAVGALLLLFVKPTKQGRN